MRIRHLIPALILTAAPVLAAGPAGPGGAPAVSPSSPIADVLCEPGARMTERLTRRYGATLASTGLRSPEQVLEVWTDARGDWTMVIAYASGMSCIVAMGEHWADAAPRDPA